MSARAMGVQRLSEQRVSPCSTVKTALGLSIMEYLPWNILHALSAVDSLSYTILWSAVWTIRRTVSAILDANCIAVRSRKSSSSTQCVGLLLTFSNTSV